MTPRKRHKLWAWGVKESVKMAGSGGVLKGKELLGALVDRLNTEDNEENS